MSGTNDVLVSVSDKQRFKKSRKIAQQNFDALVDRKAAELGFAPEADTSANVGCGTMFCRLFSLARRHRATRVATTSTAAGAAAPGSRLFGIAGRRADTAAAKLETATEQMRLRVQAVDKRVADARTDARAAMARGDKPLALRLMKKAKAAEKQQATAAAALEALERQVDLLAESALNKEIASALSASAASVKKRTKGLVDKADKAVDDSQELKDFAEDMQSALGGLHTADDYDEDELLAELAEMAEAPPPEPPTSAVPSVEAGAASDAERAATDAAALEARHAEWDAERAARAALPDAPKHGKREEKTSLLAASA